MKPLLPHLSVIIVHDNRAGHLNPSIGISNSLENVYEINLKKIITPTLKKWEISLLKKLTYYPKIFQIISSYFFNQNLNFKANCIICSGMPNLLYSIYISQKLSIPIFYAGDLRKVNDKLVQCTITALKQDIQTEQVILATPPTKNEFSKLRLIKPDYHSALLILGGPTDEHPFLSSDFEKIIKNFIIFCELNHLIGAITTSRRTPNINTYLQKIEIPSNITLHLIQDKNSPPLYNLMEKSAYLFVTEDSTSMLAEAIQSGRYVNSIYHTDSQLEPLTQKYLQLKLMTRQHLEKPFEISHQKNELLLDSDQLIIDAFKKCLGF